MKYYKGGMDKDTFLRYVDAHSETDRALFSKEMVAEVCDMLGNGEIAEQVVRGIKSWYSIDMRNDVKEIRNKEAIQL
jgi:hypothetical protein